MINTTIRILQTIMNKYQLNLNRRLLNPIQKFPEEERTISITQTLTQSTNVIITTISMIYQRKIITSIRQTVIDGNNNSKCNTNYKLLIKYKDTINESNKDKARITLKENNNQENGSKYSENNTNEETKEESKTIN